MSQQPSPGASPAAGLLELYDVALPAVYGYLLRRCGRVDLAEELTAETFLAAVDAARSGSADSPTAAWLIGVARHKLVDHWRREERVERRLHALAGGFAEDAADTWDARLDAVMARDALDRLTPAHRAALTLRYLDDLPVPEVARLLDRSRMPPKPCWCAPARPFAVPMPTPGGGTTVADPLEDRFASFFAGLRLAWPAADEPVEPNPVIATRLRARVERALTLPRGVAVSTTTLLPSVASEIETDRSAVIPYLAVRAADRALAWYAEVLGARLRGEPIMMGDGRIGHAELEIAGGVLYLADEHPEIGVAAPQPGAATVSLVLPVADVDEVAARAAEAGGQLTRPPYDGHGLRNATVVDPFGHRWMLQAPLPVEPEAAAVGAGTGQAAYRPGDVRYVSLSVPDAERAAVFYGEVLGWSVSAGPEPRSRRVANTTPAVGIWGGQERSTLFCCFAVDDIAAAVERVRAAGGTAAAATPGHGGLIADCEDDAGTAFALYQPAGDLPGSERPAANGTRPGDLAYLTLEVSDPARARAFYGAVLGWTFRPGRADRGAEVEDVVPMTGMHGGHPVAAGVPMWRVDDIDAAVRRVRRAGGTATEPVRQPYGLMAECTDDQGTRFYLGQL